MLISLKNKFIFIHNYKVAGSSIRRALEPYSLSRKQDFIIRKLIKTPFWRYCYSKHTKFLIKPIVNNIPDNSTEKYLKKIMPLVPHHANAKQAKRMIPDKIYNDYFKFGFVRNPWDWQISLYFFILQTPRHSQYELVKTLKNFDEYIEWSVYKNRRLQKDFFTDEKGNLIVDFIGKFENLEEDMNKVIKAVNLEGKITLGHHNKSDHRDYMAYYNKHTYKLVEEYFKKDIEMFGYF